MIKLHEVIQEVIQKKGNVVFMADINEEFEMSEFVQDVYKMMAEKGEEEHFNAELVLAVIEEEEKLARDLEIVEGVTEEVVSRVGNDVELATGGIYTIQDYICDIVLPYELNNDCSKLTADIVVDLVNGESEDYDEDELEDFKAESPLTANDMVNHLIEQVDEMDNNRPSEGLGIRKEVADKLFVCEPIMHDIRSGKMTVDDKNYVYISLPSGDYIKHDVNHEGGDCIQVAYPKNGELASLEDELEELLYEGLPKDDQVYWEYRDAIEDLSDKGLDVMYDYSATPLVFVNGVNKGSGQDDES